MRKVEKANNKGLIVIIIILILIIIGLIGFIYYNKDTCSFSSINNKELSEFVEVYNISF